jgi:hypothetical protein
MRRRALPLLCALAALVAAGGALPANAQDLEPRAYSASPVGTNFLAFQYSHQTGSVLVDPTLPLDDVEVSLNGATVLVGHTFGLAGRQASVAAVFPYVWGRVAGSVFEERVEVRRSGGADVRLRFATNLIGGPALTPRQFAARRPVTTLGASITVVAPTGQYDPARLVNVGSNRWAFKPELGLSHPAGPWTFEANGGVWLFAENGRYFGGKRLEQRPVGTIQGSVSYTFRPRLWVAAGATFFGGGRRVLDGVEQSGLQKNSRAGAVVSLPLSPRQSVKLSWVRGLQTRIGGDLNTFAVGWQVVWF